MASHLPIRKQVAPEIPDKLYFRIGDVARLCDVPAYVLRFWETEFPQLKPNKGGTGQRLYRRRDVEVALRIKQLLYDQGYTIPGARQVFKDEQRPRESAAPPEMGGVTPITSVASERGYQNERAAQKPVLAERQLRALRDELRALAEMLSRPAGAAAAEAAGKIKPMRPRLVETAPAEAPTETKHEPTDVSSAQEDGSAAREQPGLFPDA